MVGRLTRLPYSSLMLLLFHCFQNNNYQLKLKIVNFMWLLKKIPVA